MAKGYSFRLSGSNTIVNIIFCIFFKFFFNLHIDYSKCYWDGMVGIGHGKKHL